MHFCENPLDTLDHYDLVNEDGSFNEFAPVESLAETETDDGKKFCTTKLKIGAKLSFGQFVSTCVNFLLEKTKSVPETSGDGAQIGSSGDGARIGSSGYCAQIGSSGSCAQIGSSGNDAQIGSSGSCARIGSSGSCAQINSTGEDSVICCAGNGNIVSAKQGSWITLAEWMYDKAKDRYIPVCVATEFVDGKKIKADTPYTLKGGEFVEAAEKE